MATYAKLIYNGKMQTVALIDGLHTGEVTSLLKVVFGIRGEVVGVMAEVILESFYNSSILNSHVPLFEL